LKAISVRFLNDQFLSLFPRGILPENMLGMTILHENNWMKLHKIALKGDLNGIWK